MTLPLSQHHQNLNFLSKDDEDFHANMVMATELGIEVCIWEVEICIPWDQVRFALDLYDVGRIKQTMGVNVSEQG